MKFIRIIPFIITFLLVSNLVYGFGKNKVQYKNFEWYFIQSRHFDIYFYEGGQELAEFTAEVAESAYVQLKRDFKFDIRERIVFILYNSHNDWQQTNVVISYLEEGIGGVTELYKNRIVVPFEGNYAQFRHVIHHELVHAVMNDMLYGGSIQSLLVGEVSPAPIWFAEGLAEFQSNGWTTQIDMIVRDAVLNNYMPDLRNLQYYLVYQGGASVFKYIATTYGRGKIGEMMHKMRGKVSFERVLRSAVGIGYEEFTHRWHRYLKRQYWPDIADRKEPLELGKQLTYHRRIQNFLNVSPTISPNGDKIAFISDRRGYQNIYLMSAIDGKLLKTLVKGQRSQSFEELHFLRPGMSFSPDGKQVVFAAKNGPRDAIYVVNIKNKKVKKYDLDLDGAFTTSWSPDGEKIAFVGNKNEKSDLFVLH
ncbi:MAG: biopolymer transporter Tol, partial [Calditrichaeota bacterium]